MKMNRWSHFQLCLSSAAVSSHSNKLDDAVQNALIEATSEPQAHRQRIRCLPKKSRCNRHHFRAVSSSVVSVSVVSVLGVAGGSVNEDSEQSVGHRLCCHLIIMCHLLFYLQIHLF